MIPFSGCAPKAAYSKHLDGVTPALQPQKAKLLVGLGRCNDAAAEHASVRGSEDANAAAYEEATVQ